MAISSELLAACMVLFLHSAVGTLDPKEAGFDYFLLVRQWTPTYCGSRGPSCINWGEFTLHGLWPNFANGSWPEYCLGKTAKTFNESAIEPETLDEMSCEWFSSTGDSSTFWEHEWEKHGTCALKVFPTQDDYFSAIMQLDDRYDVQVTLEDAGLNPKASRTLDTAAVLKALKDAWGVDSYITCGKQGEFKEIQTCFGLDLKPMACPPAITKKSYCNKPSLAFPKASSEVDPSCQIYFDTALVKQSVEM